MIKIMRIKHTISSVWWLYLLSFLLLAVLGNILFGGVKEMLEYRKGFEEGMSLNARNLHFFTKDYVKRMYQQLTVDSLPEDSTIPSFYLYTDEGSLESLDSNLPSSGKTQFRQGHLRIEPDAMSSQVEFRYRGGLPLHWLYKKKSLRVKLPPFKTYLGERQFNLVNPSTIFTITDWLSYEMSSSIGLLTPTYFPARLFINEKTNGLHFFLSRVDESFLRKNKRMPGSIYSGDTIYIANPFGVTTATEMREQVFPGKLDSVSMMWRDQRLWRKNAARNAESKQDRKDISKFIEIINYKDPVQFMQGYETYFDKDKFNLFWGLDSLVGGYHHDLFHNHKIYFDPYKGKVEPIEWDVRYWSTNIPMPDYPLLKQVRLNPLLDFERNRVLYELWKKFSVEDILQRIDEKNNQVKNELAADPFRQQPDKYIKLFSKDKVVPFSMQEYAEAIEILKLTYQTRHEIVKAMLDFSSASYIINASGDKQVSLKIAVSGNTPVDIDLWSLVPDELKHRVEIRRVHPGLNGIKVEQGDSQRLFPGKVIKPGNALGQADEWMSLTFGKDRLENSPLQYDFLIQGINLTELINLDELIAVNSITGKTHIVKKEVTLPASIETKSIHPWELASTQQQKTEFLELSGEISILQDQVYHKNQQVTILPGTVFKLAKGRSLVFYGKVMARGKRANPIRFEQLINGEPWGSVIIQGTAASGSQLKYIEVSGGSISTQGLINYPGQLNIHDVNSFNVDHCVIENNSIGDDALHIAYSQGVVSQCEFNNTAFDALDMDIVDVILENSTFTDVGNDAVDLMSSTVAIQGLSITGAGDKCFSVGENSNVEIKNSQLNNCLIGVAVKDESKAYLENLQFSGMKDKAIALYRKNPRYASGGTVKGNALYGLSESDIDVETGSINHIPSNQLHSVVD